VLEHRDLATLPQALQEYIKLRIAYPDATLKELGEAADPPLSKSAINHRVRRVEQLAQEISRKEQRG
ncbi:MAG: DNA-binding protein WhiA, partial [Eggerthellaceae bacterium]